MVDWVIGRSGYACLIAEKILKRGKIRILCVCVCVFFLACVKFSISDNSHNYAVWRVLSSGQSRFVKKLSISYIVLFD